MTDAHTPACGAAPEWGGAAAGRLVGMRHTSRHTRNRTYQRVLLWLGVAAIAILGWWLLFASSSPVRVLSCVWDRASADATATTTAACTEGVHGG